MGTWILWYATYLIRFMAIRSEKELKKSSAIAIVWVVLSLGFTIAIGLLGRAFLYPEILGVTEGAPSAESVFIEMIQKVFIEKIPIPFIAGLFICGILAAVMSTADSQLLVCSSSVSKDIYQNILNPEASDKKVLNVARLTTFGVAVVAFFIAWDPNSSIMDLVSDAWAGLGAAFGPLVVYEPLLAQNESSGSCGRTGVRSSDCADLGLSSNCKWTDNRKCNRYLFFVSRICYQPVLYRNRQYGYKSTGRDNSCAV